MTLADLGELIPVLGLTYGALLAVVALVEGWHLLTDRRPFRRRRGATVPPVGVTAPDGDAEGPQRVRGGASGWSMAVPPWRIW